MHSWPLIYSNLLLGNFIISCILMAKLNLFLYQSQGLYFSTLIIPNYSLVILFAKIFFFVINSNKLKMQISMTKQVIKQKQLRCAFSISNFLCIKIRNTKAFKWICFVPWEALKWVMIFFVTMNDFLFPFWQQTQVDSNKKMSQAVNCYRSMS